MVDSWKFKLSDLLLVKLSFEVKACLVCLFVVEISKKKYFGTPLVGGSKFI